MCVRSSIMKTGCSSNTFWNPSVCFDFCELVGKKKKNVVVLSYKAKWQIYIPLQVLISLHGRADKIHIYIKKRNLRNTQTKTYTHIHTLTFRLYKRKHTLYINKKEQDPYWPKTVTLFKSDRVAAWEWEEHCAILYSLPRTAIPQCHTGRVTFMHCVAKRDCMRCTYHIFLWWSTSVAFHFFSGGVVATQGICNVGGWE